MSVQHRFGSSTQQLQQQRPHFAAGAADSIVATYPSAPMNGKAVSVPAACCIDMLETDFEGSKRYELPRSIALRAGHLRVDADGW